MLVNIMFASVVYVLLLSCCNVHIDFWTLTHGLLEDRGHDLLSTHALFTSLFPVPGEMFHIEKKNYTLHNNTKRNNRQVKMNESACEIFQRHI